MQGMRVARLLILLLAAGLPFAISMTWSVDPLAPKTALWMIAGGLLVAVPSPLTLPVGPLTVALGLAALGCLHGPVSPWPLLPLLVGTVCYLRVRELASRPRSLPEYVRFTTTVAALVALYGVSQAVFNQLRLGYHLINPFGERVLSTLGNPTFLADYLALHLPLALTLWEQSSSFPGVAGWTCAVGALTTGLVLTGSKGGQLAALAGAGAWLLMAPHPRRPGTARLAALGGVVVAGAAALWATTASPTAALARWTDRGERYSFSQRVGMLQGAVDLWREAPLLGTGPGQFPIRFPRHMPAALQKAYGVTLSVNHAHNDYAELACDLGVAGAGLILFVLFAPVRRIREPGLVAGLAASQIALGASMATNFVFFLPSSAFFGWVNAALLSPPLPPPPPSPRTRTFAFLLGGYLVLAGGRLMVATGEFHFGAAAMDRSDAPTAIAYLTRTTALTPTDRHPFQYLGRAYEFQEDWDRAIEAYGRAWALAPYHAITALNVGRAERSRYLANRVLHFPSRGRAIDALLRCVAINGYAVEPRLWGGDLAVRASRFDDAQKFYGDFPADLAPTVDWHRAREAWLSALGNGAAARMEREAGDRQEVRQLADAAEASAAAGKLEEALAFVREATTRFPREVRGWEELGYIQHTRGDLAGARTAYQQMATLVPDSLTAQLDLAVIALNSHDLAAAERYAARALHIAPDDLNAHVTLARLRAAQNRRAEAIREYEWVLARSPGHPQAREELRRLQGG